MIIRYAILVAALAALNACAPAITHDCANPGTVPVNIKFRNSEISIRPANRDAREGDAIRFKLDGEAGVAVDVLAKETSAQSWLIGERPTGGKNTFFIVCIPEDVVPADKEWEEFGYDVTVEDTGKIDPVLTVHKF